MKKLFLLAAMLLTIVFANASNRQDSLYRGAAVVYYGTETITKPIWACSRINGDTTKLTVYYIGEFDTNVQKIELGIESYEDGDYGMNMKLSGNSVYSTTVFDNGIPMKYLIIRTDGYPHRKITMIF